MTTATVQHTEGPWEVGREPGSIIKAGRGWVAQAYGMPQEVQEANTRLIAAAPDLLAALRRFAEEVESESAFPAEVALARAAIAKAEGK